MKKSEIRSAIGEAIDNKTSLSFELKDETDTKEGNPHFFGFRKMKDNSRVEAVRIFIKGNGSSVDNFRCINLDSFKLAEKTTDTFKPHPKYNPDDKDFDLKKSHKRV